MSRLWARFAGLFSSKSFIGVDKTGNKYFSRMEEIDGLGELLNFFGFLLSIR